MCFETSESASDSQFRSRHFSSFMKKGYDRVCCSVPVAESKVDDHLDAVEHRQSQGLGQLLSKVEGLNGVPVKNNCLDSCGD